MRFPLLGQWKDRHSGEILVRDLRVAKTFWQRLVGLQFARPLEPGSGLLLRNCRSIHTLWMRFAIDVIFLNEELEIVEVRRDVAPWRFVVPRAKRVAHTIEVPAGSAASIQIGRSTRIDETDGNAPSAASTRPEHRPSESPAHPDQSRLQAGVVHFEHPSFLAQMLHLQYKYAKQWNEAAEGEPMFGTNFGARMVWGRGGAPGVAMSAPAATIAEQSATLPACADD